MTFRHLAPRLLGIALLASSPVAALAQDLFLLYDGNTKSWMSAIKAAAPKGVKVSVFNMKLLKVADYSGVQKAVAKFDRAKLVVVLGARAAKPLKKTKLRTNVILVNAAASKVTGKTTLHVVTGKSPAPTKSKPIEVAKAPAMDRKNAVDGACFRLTGKFGLPEGMWRLRELLTSK